MGQANYLFFLLLLCLIPYSFHLYLWAFVAWAVTWVLEGRWLQKPSFLRAEEANTSFWKRAGVRELFFYAGILLWIGMEAISLCWSPDAKEGIGIISRHAILLIPAVTLLWGVSPAYDKRRILEVLILSAVASVGIYLMVHFWVLNQWAYYDLHHKPDVKINFFSFELLGHAKHRLYYCSLLTAAIVAAAAMMPYWRKKYGHVIGFSLSAIACLWLCVGIYWTGSRASLLNIIALACVAFVIAFHGKKRIIVICLSALLATLLGASLFRFHPRMQDLHITDITTLSSDTLAPAPEPRIAIWTTVFEAPSDYACPGLGAGAADDYLVEKYQRNHWVGYVERHYSPHNQYFSEWMELGIVGGVFFLLLMITYPFTQRKERRHAALYLSTALCLTLLTETFLNRIEGALIMFTLLLLVHISSLPDQDNLPQQPSA